MSTLNITSSKQQEETHIEDKSNVSSNSGKKCIENPAIGQESKFYYSKPKIIVYLFLIGILPITVGTYGGFLKSGPQSMGNILGGYLIILVGLFFCWYLFHCLKNREPQIIINKEGISLAISEGIFLKTHVEQFLWKDIIRERLAGSTSFRPMLIFYYIPSKSFKYFRLDYIEDICEGVLETHRARSDSPFYHQEISKQK